MHEVWASSCGVGQFLSNLRLSSGERTGHAGDDHVNRVGFSTLIPTLAAHQVFYVVTKNGRHYSRKERVIYMFIFNHFTSYNSSSDASNWWHS